jgi:hypothetical protein
LNVKIVYFLAFIKFFTPSWAFLGNEIIFQKLLILVEHSLQLICTGAFFSPLRNHSFLFILTFQVAEIERFISRWIDATSRY